MFSNIPYLFRGSGVFLEQLVVNQLVKKFPASMEPKVNYRVHNPAIEPYHQTAPSSSHLHNVYLHFNINLASGTEFLHSKFRNQNVSCFPASECYRPVLFILLDLMMVTMPSEENF